MSLIPTPEETRAATVAAAVLPNNGGAPAPANPVVATPTPTPVAPTSPFSSSAMPVISQTANTASKGAQSAMNPTPTTYSYQGSNYTMDNPPPGMASSAVSPSDPSFKGTIPTGNGYQTISTPQGPVYLYSTTPSGPPSMVNIPQASYAALQAKGLAVSQNPDGSYGLNSTSAINAGLIDAHGKLTQAGADAGLGTVGQQLGQPTTAAQNYTDPNNYAATATASLNDQLKTTLDQNQSAYQTALDNETSQYQLQLGQLHTQISQTMADEIASLYASDPNMTSGSPEIAGIKEAVQLKFQPSIDQLNETHSVNLSNLAGTLSANNASAHTSYSQSYQQILSGAATLAEDLKKTSMTLTQQATTDFMNEAKSFTLDLSTPVGLTAASALVSKAQQAGIDPTQAWALLQSGTLANSKQDQTAWLANLKSFTLPDMSKMSLSDAMKDPMLGSLIHQGGALFSSLPKDQQATAAFEAIKSSYAQQKDTMDLAKEQASIQDANARVNIASENLALRQANSSSMRASRLLTSALKANTGLQSLSVAAQYMPDIEQAKDGKGPNALVLLDGYVKLANGGQAIRGVQFETAVNSGTYGDAFTRIYNKFGLQVDANGNLTGSNVTLSPQQATEVYNAAKNLVSEKIKQAGPAFTTFKTGVDSIASQDPTNSADIYGTVSSVYDGVGNLVDTYGSSGSGGSGTSALVGGGSYQVNYNGKVYNVDSSSGAMTPQ